MYKIAISALYTLEAEADGEPEGIPPGKKIPESKVPAPKIQVPHKTGVFRWAGPERQILEEVTEPYYDSQRGGMASAVHSI